MRATVVVANAPWRWHVPFVELVRGAECVLAADGGANHLARIGVRPDAVVGDLDSIRPGVRRWVGEDRMVVRADQDFTDLHKTLEFAFDERHTRQVIVLAATGGRLDHDLENLALLVRWASRGSLELRDERHRVVPVVDETTLATTAGQGISLMPVGRCGRVFTWGLHWELHGEALDLVGKTSISNFSEGDSTAIRVDGGAILAFLFEPVTR